MSTRLKYIILFYDTFIQVRNVVLTVYMQGGSFVSTKELNVKILKLHEKYIQVTSFSTILTVNTILTLSNLPKNYRSS